MTKRFFISCRNAMTARIIAYESCQFWDRTSTPQKCDQIWVYLQLFDRTASVATAAASSPSSEYEIRGVVARWSSQRQMQRPTDTPNRYWKKKNPPFFTLIFGIFYRNSILLLIFITLIFPSRGVVRIWIQATYKQKTTRTKKANNDE